MNGGLAAVLSPMVAGAGGEQCFPLFYFFLPLFSFFHTFLPGTPIVGLLGQLACIMPGDDRRRECTLKRISISPPVDQEGTHTTVGLKRCLSLYRKHHMSVEQL